MLLLVSKDLFIVKGVVGRNEVLRDWRLIHLAKALVVGCSSHRKGRSALRRLNIGMGNILNALPLALGTIWSSIRSSYWSHIIIIVDQTTSTCSNLLIKLS